MGGEIKVALIGLDTSHTTEFARRMQAPVAIEDTLEIMSMLDAAGRSNESSQDEPVKRAEEQ